MRRLAAVATVLAAVALIAACGGSSDGPPGDATAPPDPSADTTASPIPADQSPVATIPTGPPNVFGSVNLDFEAYGEGAVEPDPPYGLTLFPRPIDGVTSAGQSVAEDGTFAIFAPPGESEIAAMGFDAPSLQDFQFLHGTGGPQFTVPEQGCVYIGAVRYSLYRLGPDLLEEQLVTLGEIEDDIELDLALTFIVSGGLVQYDGAVEAGEPSAEAAECETALAQFSED